MIASTLPTSNHNNNNNATERTKVTRLDDSDEISSLPFSEGSFDHHQDNHDDDEEEDNEHHNEQSQQQHDEHQQSLVIIQENERLKLELRAAKAEIVRLRQIQRYKNNNKNSGSFSKYRDHSTTFTTAAGVAAGASATANTATSTTAGHTPPAVPLAGSLLRAANRFPMMLASLRNNNNNNTNTYRYSRQRNKTHDSDSSGGCPSNDDDDEHVEFIDNDDTKAQQQQQQHASAQGLIHRKVVKINNSITHNNNNKKKKKLLHHLDDSMMMIHSHELADLDNYYHQVNEQAQESLEDDDDDDDDVDADVDDDDVEQQQQKSLLLLRKTTLSTATTTTTHHTDNCPITDTTNASHSNSPSSSFCASMQDRASWLVGLLILQSLSSFIISQNEKMLQQHLVIVRFLTMLVGAGGNAGNQASVRVIRGLATGAVTGNNQNDFLKQELRMAMALGGILAVAGFVRAAIFLTPLAETMAITASLFMIVVSSICLGAILPFGMKYARIDPAHSSTTIQVLMDILGVTITVVVSGMILDSNVASWLKVNNDDTT